MRDQEAFLKEIHVALKADGKFLMVEPIIHVPGRDFNRTVALAESLGYKVLARPGVMFSRAVVLGK